MSLKRPHLRAAHGFVRIIKDIPILFSGLGIGLLLLLLSLTLTSGCTMNTVGSRELAKNVYVELVDWHISGLWVFNTPVCWFRVINYNSVPIKDVRVKFQTYGYNGQPLTSGTYTMEGTIGARSVKNFVEQTVGLVDLESDTLSVELDTVEAAGGDY